MLQPRIVTGLLILAGIFYSSESAGVGALIGLISGTGIAVLADFERDDIVSGLYGYNGALVGLALFSFFEASGILAAFAVLGGALSTLVFRWMRRPRLPAYTLPFVVTTWALLAVIPIFKLAPASAAGLTGLPDLPEVPILSGLVNGIGQVMFQPNVVTGLVFLGALLISSRPAAVFAAAGSLAGMAAGRLLGVPPAALSAGVFGFNAVLCGIVFAGFRLESFLWGVGAMMLAVVIQGIFSRINLPPLTFPFVASAWLVTYLRNRLTEPAHDD